MPLRSGIINELKRDFLWANEFIDLKGQVAHFSLRNIKVLKCSIFRLIAQKWSRVAIPLTQIEPNVQS